MTMWNVLSNIVVCVCVCRLKLATAYVDINSAKDYLKRFGYLDKSDSMPAYGSNFADYNSEGIYDEYYVGVGGNYNYGYDIYDNKDETNEKFAESVKEFQKFAGLEVTGELNDETMLTMAKPRCGMKDKQVEEMQTVQPKGTKTLDTKLTYILLNLPSKSKLNRPLIENIIRAAAKQWQSKTDLSFTKSESEADAKIRISFQSGHHKDCKYDFDGEGVVFSHSDPAKGTIHLDDAETWGRIKGIKVFRVILHELGHIVGLQHSQNKESVMYPIYNPNVVKLHPEDIAAVQKINKKNLVLLPSPDPSSKPRTQPSNPKYKDPLCTDCKLDAMVRNEKGIFIFKDAKVWQINDKGIVSGFPKPSSSVFPGSPKNMDAAFTWIDGFTYLFKDKIFWRYKGLQKEAAFQRISIGFPGIPDKINAAFSDLKNKRIYFFKADQFWVYDEKQCPKVSDEYPKNLNLFKGIPKDIEAATQHKDGNMYVFKDCTYWQLQFDSSEKIEKFYSYYSYYPEADEVYDNQNIELKAEIKESVRKRWLGCDNPQNAIESYYSTDDSVDVCLQCLCKPWCQLQLNHWKKAGIESTEVGDYEWCATNTTCTTNVLKEYLQIYAQDCNWDGRISCEEYQTFIEFGACDYYDEYNTNTKLLGCLHTDEYYYTI